MSQRVWNTLSLTITVPGLLAILRDAEDDVRRAIPPRIPGPPRPDAQAFQLRRRRQLAQQALAQLIEIGRDWPAPASCSS